MKKYYTALSLLYAISFQNTICASMGTVAWGDGAQTKSASQFQNLEEENKREALNQLYVSFFRDPDAYFEKIEQANRALSYQERIERIRRAAIKRGNSALQRQ